MLGADYHIIEEGLNGRTTNVEYPDLSGTSGTPYILPCLYFSPLDLIILNIGINDAKVIFE
jgi:lysophospholipase L1-like esterase